jgi:hypothetical protein
MYLEKKINGRAVKSKYTIITFSTYIITYPPGQSIIKAMFASFKFYSEH